MKMKVSIKVQGLITAIAIIIVTILSLIFLQQLIGVFNAATLNAVFITAIVVVAARWIHTRFVTA
jgi:hypothetical protein